MSAAIGVVVVAAGTGDRLGADRPKALVPVAGRPLLAHALAGLATAGLPAAVVVHAPDHRQAFAAAAGDLPVAAWVPGGATRTASVRAGVAALDATVATVVVHDAARPLMPAAVIAAAVEAVAADGADELPVLAAAPAVPVADTLKRVDGDRVLATVDRSDLVGVQTPQVFTRAALRAALELGDDATDELGLVERLVAEGRLHGQVRVVAGSAWGRKVTHASDLAVVDALAGAVPPSDAATSGPPTVGGAA